MTLQRLVDREIGVSDCSSDINCSLPGRFVCKKRDEHHIEGQEFGVLIPPLACSFCKTQPYVLAAADEDGGILILNTRQSHLRAVLQDWRAHSNAVFDVDWVPGESQLLTASGDQCVALWDVAEEKKISAFRGHSSSVKTVRVQRGNGAVFATGARDGHIMLWDSRVKQKDGSIPAVNCIRHAHMVTTGTSSAKKKKLSVPQDCQASVTAVIFQDENTLMSAGTVDGSVKVWDLRKNYTMFKGEATPKFVFPYAGTSVRTHGFSSLTLDASSSSLFASCMDNVIYQFDCIGLNKSSVAQFRGHHNSSFYVRTALSGDGRYLLSGSGDHHAYIWRVDRPRAPAWTLQGHTGEVSAVAWSAQDVGTLVTLGDDSTLRLWRLGGWEQDSPVRNSLLGPLVGHSQRAPALKFEDTLKAGPKRGVPLTPKKGKTVPPSPAKPSSSLREFLASVANSRPNTAAGARGFVRPCTMSQWLARGSHSTSSVNQQGAPRHNITPKKLCIKALGSQTTTSPSMESNTSLDRSNVRAATSCKRKLYGRSSPQSSPKTKRAKVDGDENGMPVSMCSRLDQTSPTESAAVLRTTENIFRPLGVENVKKDSNIIQAKKNLFPASHTSDSTPPKTSCHVTVKDYRSPTVNLPNYVEDPQPRTPVARVPDSLCGNRTPDWLTKMRLKRLNSAEKQVSDVDCDTEDEALATESQSKGSLVQKQTPENKKGSLSRRGSILKYFSPKSMKDNTKT